MHIRMIVQLGFYLAHMILIYVVFNKDLTTRWHGLLKDYRQTEQSTKIHCLCKLNLSKSRLAVSTHTPTPAVLCKW